MGDPPAAGSSASAVPTTGLSAGAAGPADGWVCIVSVAASPCGEASGVGASGVSSGAPASSPSSVPVEDAPRAAAAAPAAPRPAPARPAPARPATPATPGHGRGSAPGLGTGVGREAGPDAASLSVPAVTSVGIPPTAASSTPPGPASGASVPDSGAASGLPGAPPSGARCPTIGTASVGRSSSRPAIMARSSGSSSSSRPSVDPAATAPAPDAAAPPVSAAVRGDSRTPGWATTCCPCSSSRACRPVGASSAGGCPAMARAGPRCQEIPDDGVDAGGNAAAGAGAAAVAGSRRKSAMSSSTHPSTVISAVRTPIRLEAVSTVSVLDPPRSSAGSTTTVDALSSAATSCSARPTMAGMATAGWTRRRWTASTRPTTIATPAGRKAKAKRRPESSMLRT